MSLFWLRELNFLGHISDYCNVLPKEPPPSNFPQSCTLQDVRKKIGSCIKMPWCFFYYYHHQKGQLWWDPMNISLLFGAKNPRIPALLQKIMDPGPWENKEENHTCVLKSGAVHIFSFQDLPWGQPILWPSLGLESGPKRGDLTVGNSW